MNDQVTDAGQVRRGGRISGGIRVCLTANGVDVPFDIELRSDPYIPLLQA